MAFEPANDRTVHQKKSPKTNKTLKWDIVNLRWSSCLKECQENLNYTDYCRVIFLFVKYVGQQLLHSLLSERKEGTCTVPIRSLDTYSFKGLSLF